MQCTNTTASSLLTSFEASDCEFASLSEGKKPSLYFCGHTTQSPERDLKHLIFLSSVVICILRKSSPPCLLHSLWLLWHLTFRFQACSLHMGFRLPPPLRGLHLNGALIPSNNHWNSSAWSGEPIKQKCFWRISETSGRTDDLAQSNQHNQMR